MTLPSPLGTLQAIGWPPRGPVVLWPRLTPGRLAPRPRCRNTSRPASGRETPNAEVPGCAPGRRTRLISGLRDVPLNRRGRLITDSGPSADHRDPRPRPSGNGAASNRGPRVSTSRRAEPVRDHVRCPIAAPCHLDDRNSRKKVQNVRGDSSANPQSSRSLRVRLGARR